MLAVSITEGVYCMCGLARKPATTYPSTKGCLSFLNSSVISPAQTNIKARSLINVAKCDIIRVFIPFLQTKVQIKTEKANILYH